LYSPCYTVHLIILRHGGNLCPCSPPRHARRNLRSLQDGRVVEAPGLPVIDRAPDLQAIDAADHFVDRAEAEPGHVLAHFLGDEAEEVDNELRLARELLAQLRILRRDADRARVEVADAH